MKRTQIYLADDQAAALEALSRKSGLSKSQLIRDAIYRTYLGGADADASLRLLAASSGAWRRRTTGERYVESLRSGRLGRIHRGKAGA